MTVTGYHSQYH